VIGARVARSAPPARRAASAVTLTAVLLAVTLSGCGGRGSDTSPAGSPAPAGSARSEGSGGPAAGGVDQKTAAQIEGAVNDAQSELDGLDQDFAGDDAAAN
jgi:hypothetical protein